MSPDSAVSKYLYIPLEIYSRELNGMLLLSVIAASHGWKVIIGGKGVLFPLIGIFPDGVVLLKSIVPGELNLQQKIREYGHKIASLDAEGLIPSNGEPGVKLRFSDKSIESTELIFFWGNEQFEQVKKVYPLIKSNGLVTGSPVHDYWKILKSQSLNSKPDQTTILIATSFPYPNHFVDKTQPYRAVRDASGENASEELLDELFLEGKLQETVYPFFKEMVTALAKKFPDIRYILRPHPSESIAPWKEISDEFKNVELQTSGEISGWLLESDILIHFNSTTSIEAYTYDKKVITFIPPLEEVLNGKLSEKPLLVSTVCRSIDDVASAIENFAGNPVMNDLSLLKSLIHESDSEQVGIGAQNIVNHLDSIACETADNIPSRIKIFINSEVFVTKLKFRIIWMMGWLDHLFNLFSGKYAHTRKRYEYGKSKRGSLPEATVVKRVESLSSELGIQVKVRKIKNALFFIEKRSSP
jgi:surface carbohydrate biosynthesis protein